MSTEKNYLNIAINSKKAANILKTIPDEKRCQLLIRIHDALKDNALKIKNANDIDLKQSIEQNFSSSLIKRLDLFKGDKFDVMLKGIKEVIALQDPTGKLLLKRQLDDNLTLYKKTVPIGSLLVIFESRPEVIANIVSLSLKSGNACILKGGKESINTFKVMADIINTTISSSFDELNVPMAAVQLIETRDDVNQLLAMDGIIDLVVPRGSNALVKRIKDNTKIPVLGHADGICSIYADNHISQSINQAKKIIIDAKTNYPAGCNAVETLLINKHLKNWDELLKALINEKVTVHLMPDVKLEFLKLNPSFEDNQFVVDVNQDIEFDQEFLSFDIAVKFVDNVNDAIDHINHHGSKHTDCILTEDEQVADFFLKSIESCSVYWNCSTRFADGFRYGFGTEVGISTSKIHARGPVGLDGLVTYQYQIIGKGQIVGDYVGSGGSREFNHKDLEI
ncbi:probable Gamma-glutamyl phosphate reductase [Hanseniaspora guilliermondii]|uniref:glutamate-5-semialdehyde dehydrogenase n=1 Tax=Hanseniaspora guilliermondii TaxID=56406 RepID=A0A1L0CW81_9ASCO|nr:probable Gamma-glutamyl phosphate reductase [Hanseniaspora guilliermondii]